MAAMHHSQRKKHGDLVFGVHPVLETLAASADDVREVLVARTIRRGTFEKVEAAARRSGCSVDRVEAGALDALTGHARHQGVVARVAPFKYADFPALLAALRRWRNPCVVFLDGITDPRNFGSILRTCEAMGVGDVVIPRDRAVGVTPTVVKASAGAAQHVRIYRVSNLVRSLATLREQGLWILGLDPSGERQLHETTLPERLAMVVGGEGKGMRPLVRSTCDYLVSIRMQGRVESMNVSVAWGLFAYELMRQRSSNCRTC